MYGVSTLFIYFHNNTILLKDWKSPHWMSLATIKIMGINDDGYYNLSEWLMNVIYSDGIIIEYIE